MKTDRAYLERLAERLGTPTRPVKTILRMGDPATEIIRAAEESQADLIAMSTHGHRFINDLLRGTTVDRVRHIVKVPVLLLRAHPPASN
jgi:manganese transport protein